MGRRGRKRQATLAPRDLVLSVRYPHKLFQEHDVTVAGWIRGRCLDRWRRDLADPTLGAVPLSVTAGRWGIADGAHFSRIFRAASGVPPREYRQRARRLGAGPTRSP